MQKTITLGNDDNPMFTILEGHVSSEVFTKAYRAEGWQFDEVSDDDISFEYWIKREDGSWDCSYRGAEGAIPVTVLAW